MINHLETTYQAASSMVTNHLLTTNQVLLNHLLTTS